MDIAILGEYRYFGQENSPDRLATSIHPSGIWPDLPLVTDPPQSLLFPPIIDGTVPGSIKQTAAPRGYDVELVVSKSRVTWAQGTVLRKVLDYSSEAGTVIQALFVWFADSTNAPTQAPTPISTDQPKDASQQGRRQALVVILQGVAKIYFHNGETHSVRIPFRVHKAWAMDLGLLIEIPYDKNIGVPPFYTIMGPLEEFAAVSMVPAPSSRIQETEVHNTLKHLSCMDPLHSIAVTVDVVQKRFRVWNPDAKVFGAHALDGSYVFCIFSKTRKKVECYTIGDEIKALWTRPAADAISLQATRPNLLDVLILPLANQGPGLLLWTGYAAEFVSCQAKVDKIVQLKDAVQDRVSLVLSTGVITRAQLSFVARSSLVRETLDALSYALPIDLLQMAKHRFLQLEFSQDSKCIDVRSPREWDNLVTTLLSLINIDLATSPAKPEPESDWDVFLNSDMHRQLGGHPSFRGSTVLLPPPSSNPFTDIIHKSRQLAALHSNTPPTSSLDHCLKFVITALHLVLEDRKINLATCREGDPMPLLMLLCHLSGKTTWIDFYARYDTSNRWITALQNIHMDKTAVPLEDHEHAPPDLFKWISDIVSRSPAQATESFPTLLSIRTERDPTQTVFVRLELPPCHQTKKITKLFTTLMLDIDGEQAVVRALASDEFSNTFLDQLPFGVSLPLREAIWKCRRNPSPDLGPKALSFIGRNDLAELKSINQPGHYITMPSRRATEPAKKRDIHSLCKDVVNTGEENDLVTLGTEIADSEVTNLRFGADKRVAETQRMLQSSSILEISAPDDMDLSEEDVRTEHQDLLRRLAQRTLALPVGRAILTFGTLASNLPQKYPVPLITLSAKLTPSHGVTEFDVSTIGGEHVLDWPQFHNGVAAGLRISPNSTDVKGSWVIYNRPTTLDSTHAGFLLALGLTGHLRVLSASQLYRYLTAEHEMTSTGLLLGMACANRGTMDRMTTKQLALRIPGLLPPEAAPLNLSLLDQISCVLGIGLLYMETSNRGMAEVMLSEIGRIPQGHELQECHSLAAGFALGFVTLAQGNRQTELNDMKIVEVLMGHMPGSNYRSGLGRGSSGASVALGLMFLRTNDVLIADKLRVPDTQFDLDYFTPDALTLRVICRCLVLWDSIVPTKRWILSQVPRYLKNNAGGPPKAETSRQSYYAILAGCCFALGLRFAGSSNETAFECVIHYVDMFRELGRNAGDGSYESSITKSSIRRCLDISVVAAAMVVAGSGRIDFMRRLRILHKRTSGDISYGSHMAYHMALGLLFVGGGGYTLGTSPSCVATLLCSLYPRFPTSPTDNRSHLQAFRHLWVLALEPRCLVTRETHTGACCSVPVRIHLKAAYYQSQIQIGLDRRGSVTEDWIRSRQAQGPLFGSPSTVVPRATQDPNIVVKDEVLETMTPCLLPELALISKIEVLGPRYWPITLDMSDGQLGRTRLWRILKARSMAVIRHLGHLSYADDPLGTRGVLARPFPKLLDGEMDETQIPKGNMAQRIEQMLRDQFQRNRASMQQHLGPGGSGENSKSYGEDFCGIFMQDPQVTAFANYLCRALTRGQQATQHNRVLSVDDQQDEARAVFFTEVLYECLTADKVEALGAHVWLFDIANRLETLDTLSMQTIWELRIVKNYYDTQRRLKGDGQERYASGQPVFATKATDEDGSETLVKVGRIYELFAKFTKKVEEQLDSRQRHRA
ncbi:Anaphase-promoting complex subunit 1 [Podila minutissima]|nr:Anaphase-promoting complex subunit 1 [Podila minutissima]